ncbi:MAG: 50S ribosomal protein L25 [Acidimicrobiales bacterium]
MAEITLSADTGRPTGSRTSNRLRATGQVPGVVYGLAADPTPVSVDWRQLRQALTTEAGLNALIDLTVNGETKLSIVKELQRNPITHRVDHVDFLLIRRDQAILVDVPLVLEGEAEKVTTQDGMVDQILVSLAVHAKPADIPNEIVIDISNMEIGDAVRVGDLRLPAGVTTDLDEDEAIVTASIASTTLEAAEIEAADAEVAAEQAAEGDGEEGGGPAAAGEGGAEDTDGANEGDDEG